FFFFQAEDGIRDFHVTGVQTCALPILERLVGVGDAFAIDQSVIVHGAIVQVVIWVVSIFVRMRPSRHEVDHMETSAGLVWREVRSEERRVGKEGGCGWWE